MVSMMESPGPGLESPLPLIERIRQGDRDAFSELVRRYQRQAFGLAHSFLKSVPDAEDVAQDAFLKAFEKLGTFDASGSFEAWFFTIVANLARKKLRWHKVRTTLTLSLDAPREDDRGGDPTTPQVPGPEARDNPERLAESGWRAGRLQEALAGLPEQQQTALRLKYVEGWKISEVARLMGLAEGTVKAHLFRGTEKLRKVLENGNDL